MNVKPIEFGYPSENNGGNSEVWKTRKVADGYEAVAAIFFIVSAGRSQRIAQARGFAPTRARAVTAARQQLSAARNFCNQPIDVSMFGRKIGGTRKYGDA